MRAAWVPYWTAARGCRERPNCCGQPDAAHVSILDMLQFDSAAAKGVEERALAWHESGPPRGVEIVSVVIPQELGVDDHAARVVRERVSPAELPVGAQPMGVKPLRHETSEH